MKKFLLIVLLPSFLFAQNIKDGIQRDTSFTLSSTAKKIMQDYPHASPVIYKPSDKTILLKNLVYSSINGRNLQIDIFEPSNRNSELLPPVVLIHGGGWRSGSKELEWNMAQAIAENGFICATVEYRLSPEALYPAAVHDIKTAIRWLKENSKKFNLDKNKIAVYGTSAGGQLAALVGTTFGMEKFEGENSNLNYSSDVHAIIDVDGILDFTHPAESNKDSDPLKPSAGKAWFGYSYKEKPELWMEASPFNYVTEKTPPILFINSSQDRFHAGRDYMIEKMNIYNIYSEVHTIPDTPHPFWLFHPWFKKTLDYTVTFLNRVFKKQK